MAAGTANAVVGGVVVSTNGGPSVGVTHTIHYGKLSRSLFKTKADAAVNVAVSAAGIDVAIYTLDGHGCGTCSLCLLPCFALFCYLLFVSQRLHQQ